MSNWQNNLQTFMSGFQQGRQIAGSVGDTMGDLAAVMRQRKTDRIAQYLANGGSLDVRRAQATGPQAQAIQAAADARAPRQAGMFDGLGASDLARLQRLDRSNDLPPARQQASRGPQTARPFGSGPVGQPPAPEAMPAPAPWRGPVRPAIERYWPGEDPGKKARLQAGAVAAVSAADPKFQESLARANAFTTVVKNAADAMRLANSRQEYDDLKHTVATAYLGAANAGMTGLRAPELPEFRGDVMGQLSAAWQKYQGDPARSGAILQHAAEQGYHPDEFGAQSSVNGIA